MADLTLSVDEGILYKCLCDTGETRRTGKDEVYKYERSGTVAEDMLPMLPHIDVVPNLEYRFCPRIKLRTSSLFLGRFMDYCHRLYMTLAGRYRTNPDRARTDTTGSFSWFKLRKLPLTHQIRKEASTTWQSPYNSRTDPDRESNSPPHGFSQLMCVAEALARPYGCCD
jgi:hypothetical protein